MASLSRVRLPLVLPLVMALAAAGGGGRARADDGGGRARDDGDAPPRNYFNLRIGGATSSANGRLEFCGEVAPTSFLSVEGCGTGSELLYAQSDAHISHYLLKLRLGAWRIPRGWLEARVGAGFAEMQVLPDGFGFDFTSAGPHGEATSGGEASFSLRALTPLWRGVDLVLELRTSLAYMPHAPELATPLGKMQPSAGFTAGVGF